MNDQQSTYEKFLKLRAATVESIALAWSDDKLKKAYMENPVKFMQDHLHYQFPFQMEMKIAKAETVDQMRTWKPEDTGGWVGPNNTLVMILPPKPEEETQEAIALSAYNADHLTFFGGKKKE